MTLRPGGATPPVRPETRVLDAALALVEAEDPRVFVEAALELALVVSGAQRGYVGLYDPPSTLARWWTARAVDDADLARISGSLSSGILGETVRSGVTVRTVSAIDDPRFAANTSVRRHGIEAVVCAPIGCPVIGALYLQGRPGGGPFSDADVELVEKLARRIASLTERLLATVARGPRAPDPTARSREKLDLRGLVGRSQALARVFAELEWIVPSPLDVLITGPSGSGKSELARVIHRNSGRTGALVPMNCAAVAEGLFESELFGVAKGAYTDAVPRSGYVAMAEGGTLFLDEVGELPLSLQAKLLTFLQDRVYYVVGAPGRPVEADVRVIAATNVDLREAMASRRFRLDLYERLRPAEVHLPPLSARIEDIGPLARHLLQSEPGAEGLRLSPMGEVALEHATWPGDVRELQSCIRRAVYRARQAGDTSLDPRHLFPDHEPVPSGPPTFQDATRRFQRELLLGRLREHGGNVSATARSLDLARSHLYTLIDALGLRSEL